jgi:hypothetical protein
MHHVELRVATEANRHEGVAVLTLYETGARLCDLDIQYSLLRDLRNQNAVALDFLMLASAVYALDKTILRAGDGDGDGWTRDISLSVPVSDPSRWTNAAPELQEAVTFLTGDRWSFAFAPLNRTVARPGQAGRRWRRQAVLPIRALDTVCLFSGGLDSLVGAIDRLERTASTMLLIGHHDAKVAGPFADQRRLIEPLRSAYPQRLRPVFLRVGQKPAGDEITLRSRSLLFIALGMYGASAVGPHTELLIPENGTIALNYPLTPSRRGSCSTRTAHPYFLNTLSGALRSLGIVNPLVNPLGSKTKGQVVQDCANSELLGRLTGMTVSCAKRNRRGHWKRTTARECGECMPCVYRRAALHRLAADSEVYGNDICAGEVEVLGDDDAGRDFRACLSLLRRRPSAQEVMNTLMASGPLDVARLPEYAALVLGAMDEVRHLLRDKGIPDVRRAAGMTV